MISVSESIPMRTPAKSRFPHIIPNLVRDGAKSRFPHIIPNLVRDGAKSRFPHIIPNLLRDGAKSRITYGRWGQKLLSIDRSGSTAWTIWGSVATDQFNLSNSATSASAKR